MPISRKRSCISLSQLENICMFVIIWTCILSIHYAYKRSGEKVIDESQVIHEKNPVVPVKKTGDSLIDDQDEFNQAELAAEVQRELEESKKAQAKVMIKEQKRRKEGEFYSMVNAEEVFKWFDDRPNNKTNKEILTDKKHQELPKYLITGNSICSSGKIDILFYVHSKLDNEKNRNGIRQTYGNIQNFKRLNIKIVFILGRPVDEVQKKKIIKESETHKDIVQTDFKDIHTNLGYKVLTFLQWVVDHCSDPTPRYIIKVDDDFFVNPFMIIEEIISDLWQKSNFVACHSKENSPVVRNKNSKWYVPETVFPKNDPDVFEKTCSGYTAIFPGDMVASLRSIAVDLPVIPVDDGYLFSFLYGKIKDPEYIQILDYMTLNKEAGFDDYKGMKRLKFVSVTCWGDDIIGNMNILWKGTLRHLTTLGKQLINPKRLK